MKNNINKFIKIIFMGLFIIINYYLGVLIANGIDKFFSPSDFNNKDKLIVTYIVLEYFIAIIIYLLIQRLFNNRLKTIIYINIGFVSTDFIKSIFIISFSYGLFNNLNALSEYSRYIYHKHIVTFISGKKIIEEENNV